MKVKANEKFEGIRDAERNVYPKAGDIWETNKERAEFLQSKGVVEIIEEPKEVDELNVEYFTKGNNDKEAVIPANNGDIITKEFVKAEKPKKKKTNKKK